MAVEVDRITVDAMTGADWPGVAEIYRQGLEAGDASFETEVPVYDVWDRAHLSTPRLVARLDGVGRRERLGKHRGVWRDVLLVERRSGAIE